MNAPSTRFEKTSGPFESDDVSEYCECRSVPPRDNTGWIDADERMPEEGKVVLVCTLDGYRWTASCQRDQWQLTGDTHILLDRAEVTHWRELPEPPRTEPADGFEAWWRMTVKDGGALVITKDFYAFSASKEAARYIWEAALASAANSSTKDK